MSLAGLFWLVSGWHVNDVLPATITRRVSGLAFVIMLMWVSLLLIGIRVF